jgi:DNA-binding ferritin-like protein
MPKFLSILSQLRVFHWQTKSFAEHKALGKLYDSLSDLIDTFIETYSGCKGSVPSAKEFFSEAPVDYKSVDQVLKYLDTIEDYFVNDLSKSLKDPEQTSLLNIRDDMLGRVQHTKYLLRLK